MSTATATPRAQRVAEWFGIRDLPNPAHANPTATPPRTPLPRLRPGQIVLLTGASGSGKSTLLGRLRRRQRRRNTRWVDLANIPLPRRPVIDLMADALGGGSDDATIITALDALSRVGLGEVWTYLRTPAQLSEGQRFRMRLALAIARAQNEPDKPTAAPRALTVLASDEFGAALDRVTAMVVARALGRAIANHPHLCAVLATSHDDLAAALDPDLTLRCDFGITTQSHSHQPPQSPAPQNNAPQSLASSRPQNARSRAQDTKDVQS